MMRSPIPSVSSKSTGIPTPLSLTWRMIRLRSLVSWTQISFAWACLTALLTASCAMRNSWVAVAVSSIGSERLHRESTSDAAAVLRVRCQLFQRERKSSGPNPRRYQPLGDRTGLLKNMLNAARQSIGRIWVCGSSVQQITVQGFGQVSETSEFLPQPVVQLLTDALLLSGRNLRDLFLKLPALP